MTPEQLRATPAYEMLCTIFHQPSPRLSHEGTRYCRYSFFRNNLVGDINYRLTAALIGIRDSYRVNLAVNDSSTTSLVFDVRGITPDLVPKIPGYIIDLFRSARGTADDQSPLAYAASGPAVGGQAIQFPTNLGILVGRPPQITDLGACTFDSDFLDWKTGDTLVHREGLYYLKRGVVASNTWLDSCKRNGIRSMENVPQTVTFTHRIAECKRVTLRSERFLIENDMPVLVEGICIREFNRQGNFNTWYILKDVRRENGTYLLDLVAADNREYTRVFSRRTYALSPRIGALVHTSSRRAEFVEEGEEI